MSRLLAALSLCITIQIQAQQLQFGNIRPDSNYSCKGVLNLDNKSIDSLYGLRNLCQSKNALEIRLGILYSPLSVFHLVVLTYNGQGWSAKRMEGSLPNILYGNKNDRNIDSFNLVPKVSFDSIFQTLKANNVFTLGNQKDLKPDGLVDDGAFYFLLFKAGNKFGGYSFNNPGAYKQAYKEMPQFSNYAMIKTVFISWLVKK